MIEKDSNNIHDGLPLMTSFWRSQATSFVASFVDFGLYALMFYIISLDPILSSASGNILGAIISFFLSRHWAFENTRDRLAGQIFRYIVTSISSAVINSYGIYLLITTTILEPTIAKIIIAILVGIFFNFPMFKYFVYRESKAAV